MPKMKIDTLKQLLMIFVWTAVAYFGSEMILATFWGFLAAIGGLWLHYDMHGYLKAHHSWLVFVGVFFRIFSVLIAVAAFILASCGRLPGTKIRGDAFPQQAAGIHGPFIRVMFTILWAFVFFIVTLFVGATLFPIIGKIEGWDLTPPISVAIAWTVIWFASPLVALSLGSRGLLPGTKKKFSQDNGG